MFFNVPDTALGDASLSDPITILAPLVAALAAVVVIYGPEETLPAPTLDSGGP
jgi:hypothetical protein